VGVLDSIRFVKKASREVETTEADRFEKWVFQIHFVL
jgi:hypothetical protein